MKFCQPHWDKLRSAIEGEGLGELIARDGETAAAQLAHAIGTEETSLVNFDPLMSAHWAIIGRISEHAPAVVFVEGCPLCWVADEHEQHCSVPDCGVTRDTFEKWIPSVAAHMRREYDRLKAEAA